MRRFGFAGLALPITDGAWGRPSRPALAQQLWDTVGYGCAALDFPPVAVAKDQDTSLPSPETTVMRHPFFPPEPAFAWAYCLALFALTVWAAVVDYRRLTIPKVITLPALALGVLFSLARGAWLGATGEAVWILGANGAGIGALDAFLYAAAGFAAGFALFFIMYFLGTCGGGDVKLFAALGAWVGPFLVLFLLLGTMLFVVLLSVLRLFGGVVSRGYGRTMRDYSLKAGPKAGKGQTPRPRKRLMAYSLPVALSTACVLLWVFRAELHLAAPKPEPNQVSLNGIK